MIIYLYRALNLKSTIILWPLIHCGSQFSGAREKPSFLAI